MTSSGGADLSRFAVVTGGSRGLGRALTLALVRRGWHVTVDGRDRARLDALVHAAPGPGTISVIGGDIADPGHRAALIAPALERGALHLLVNNASVLGPSPQPELASYPIEALHAVYAVNVFGPLALTQQLLPALESCNGRIINVSSDAAVEAYEGWGGYGSSKAALDHLTAVLAVECPGLRVYAVDPGDMATDLQQQAFPGEDISDRADPVSVVPAFLELIDGGRASGRYRVADLLAAGLQ